MDSNIKLSILYKVYMFFNFENFISLIGFNEVFRVSAFILYTKTSSSVLYLTFV